MAEPAAVPIDPTAQRAKIRELTVEKDVSSGGFGRVRLPRKCGGSFGSLLCRPDDDRRNSALPADRSFQNADGFGGEVGIDASDR